MAIPDNADTKIDATLVRRNSRNRKGSRPIPADATAFGPLVVDLDAEPAAPLLVPAGLPSRELAEDDEAATVMSYNEPSLPLESQERRILTDKIRARRQVAASQPRRIVAASDTASESSLPSLPSLPMLPDEESSPEITPPPASERRRRPTVPSRRPSRDWALERIAFEPSSEMPQRFIGTMISPAFRLPMTQSDEVRARSLTMVSMAMSALAGVFLAAALANLLG